MHGKIKVGVKFCGSCNPSVDAASIMEKAGTLTDEIEFVAWHREDKDLLLVLSACQVHCVTKPLFDGPVIELAGDMLEGRRWGTEELAGAVIDAVLRRGREE